MSIPIILTFDLSLSPRHDIRLWLCIHLNFVLRFKDITASGVPRLRAPEVRNGFLV